MTSKLDLYNAALVEIGEREIASLAENREPRRVLDSVYDAVLAQCLEEGQWNHALRTVSLTADAALTTGFGYQNVFEKPTDWLRTVGISADEFFNQPLLTYSDETAYWLSDASPIYVRYVSNDTSFGLDLTRWSSLYTNFVYLSLAQAAIRRITSNKSDKEQLTKDVKAAKRDALAKDAMNEPPKFMPTGSWVTSRGGRNRERGSLTRLIG